MTPEQQALRAAYLAELWPYTPEVPRHERAIERARATARNEALDGWHGDGEQPADVA